MSNSMFRARQQDKSNSTCGFREPSEWLGDWHSSNGIESGCSLLESQYFGKVGGKEILLFFSFLEAGNQGEGRLGPKSQHSIASQWVRAFKGEFQECVGGGATCRTSPSALMATLKSGISGLTSAILIVLSTFTLQYQGRFAPISSRPVFVTVAADVMPIVWPSCS